MIKLIHAWLFKKATLIVSKTRLSDARAAGSLTSWRDAGIAARFPLPV